MSGHHEEHHSMEQKPVSFTVPFYLAAATILAVVLFLSLCDPKPHHAVEGHGHEGAATEATHHESATEEHHSENHPAAAIATEKSDSLPVETTAPEAEPAHH